MNRAVITALLFTPALVLAQSTCCEMKLRLTAAAGGLAVIVSTTNIGQQVVTIKAADEQMKISVSSSSDNEPIVYGKRFLSAQQNDVALAPGETLTQTLGVNRPYLGLKPGTYTVTFTRSVTVEGTEVPVSASTEVHIRRCETCLTPVPPK